jgi:hypothetical protein
VDLTDTSEWLQMIGKVGPPHSYPDAPPALRECTHGMTADKAGAAENRNQAIGWRISHLENRPFGIRRASRAILE